MLCAGQIGKYANYTCGFKQSVVNYAKDHSKREAARYFDVNETQVRYWRSQKDRLHSAKRTRMAFRGPKSGKFPEVESAVL